MHRLHALQVSSYLIRGTPHEGDDLTANLGVEQWWGAMPMCAACRTLATQGDVVLHLLVGRSIVESVCACRVHICLCVF